MQVQDEEKEQEEDEEEPLSLSLVETKLASHVPYNFVDILYTAQNY